MKNKCNYCVFADWRLTRNGTLHRSGEGVCTWTAEVKIPYSALMHYGGTGNGGVVKIHGGRIDRLLQEPTSCATFESKGGC